MRTHSAKVETAPPPKKITLSALARAVLADNDGDVAAATATLVERLENERWLLQAVADEAIGQAVEMFVQSAHRSERAAIVRSMTAPKLKLDFAAVTTALVSTHTRMFLDFPLSGGVKLRDATREEVEQQAARYSTQGRDMMHKARWLERVARLVKPGQVVGESVKEATVVKLFSESADV